MRAWGSFEQWSAQVRAPLIWAGQPDPYLSRSRLEDGDGSGAAEEQLFRGLAELLGTTALTAKEIVDRLDEEKHRHDQLRDAIPELIAVKPGYGLTPRTLGYLFRRLTGKVRAGLRLCVVARTGGGRRFRVETVRPRADTADDADDSGRSVSNPCPACADGDDDADDSPPWKIRELDSENFYGPKESALSSPSALRPDREQWRRAIRNCPHSGVTVRFPDGESITSIDSNTSKGDEK
jgi:hypothetical protein